MRYVEYKTASLKHLQTCEYMIANLQNGRVNKLEVLCNVYYLCGYSLECIVNFWIFELLKRNSITFTRRVPDRTRHGVFERIEDVTCLDHKLDEGVHLCFSAKQNSTRSNIFWLEQHDFKRNVQVFEYLADGDRLSTVPIIGDSENEPYDKMSDIFNGWKPTVRYQKFPESFPYPYSTSAEFLATFETDISNFVNTARLIYNEFERIENNW